MLRELMLLGGSNGKPKPLKSAGKESKSCSIFPGISYPNSLGMKVEQIIFYND